MVGHRVQVMDGVLCEVRMRRGKVYAVEGDAAGAAAAKRLADALVKWAESGVDTTHVWPTLLIARAVALVAGGVAVPIKE